MNPLHPLVLPLLGLRPPVFLRDDVSRHLRTFLAFVRVLHLTVHRQAVGHNVYMRLARVKVYSGYILTFGQLCMPAAHLQLGLTRPLVDDWPAVFAFHRLPFEVGSVQHLNAVLAESVPLRHRPVLTDLRRRTQFDTPERLFCLVPGCRLQQLHVHQHFYGRVGFARQRIQFDVVGGEEDRLVLLPCLLLVEHIVDGVGGMRPVYRVHLDDHTLTSHV